MRNLNIWKKAPQKPPKSPKSSAVTKTVTEADKLEDTIRKIGENIKYEREKKNMSRKDLARKVGLSTCQEYRHETGDSCMKVDTLWLYAIGLEVDPRDLLSDTEQGRKSPAAREPIASVKDEADIVMKIGKNIASKRKCKEMTREQLAVKTGISYKQIYRHETGKMSMKLDTFFLYAKGLEEDPRDLM